MSVAGSFEANVVVLKVAVVVVAEEVVIVVVVIKVAVVRAHFAVRTKQQNILSQNIQ